MLEKLLGATFKRVILPIAAGLARIGLSANSLTVAGFLVTLASAWVIAAGPHVTAGIVLLAGALFDSLDGAVARVSGTGSKRGAFLDSTLDRLSDAAMFTGVLWRFASMSATWVVTVGSPQEQVLSVLRDDRSTWGIGLALGALILGFMVSYVRARAEGLGYECRVGIAERPERVIIVALGLLSDLLVPALALLCVLSLVTLVQRFVHVWHQAAPA
ncbi:MAG: CDP-alcohol phosphatidyltransferase family protein [Actinomycetota bacterium]